MGRCGRWRVDGDQGSPPSEGGLCAEVHRRNRSSLEEDGRDHLRLREQHELKHEGEKKQGMSGKWQGTWLSEGRVSQSLKEAQSGRHYCLAMISRVPGWEFLLLNGEINKFTVRDIQLNILGK